MVRVCDLALTRRAALRHRAYQVRLSAFSGINVQKVRVEDGALCAGKPIRDIALPRDCVLTALRRRRQVLIPHEGTTLRPGDVLVAVTERNAAGELTRLCAPPVR